MSKTIRHAQESMPSLEFIKTDKAMIDREVLRDLKRAGSTKRSTAHAMKMAQARGVDPYNSHPSQAKAMRTTFRTFAMQSQPKDE